MVVVGAVEVVSPGLVGLVPPGPAAVVVAVESPGLSTVVSVVVPLEHAARMRHRATV